MHEGDCPPARTLVLGSAEPAGAGAPPAVDPLIGTRVGSFDVVRMLGQGGMGTVYLGEHPAIGSRVAIKFLHESMASDAQVVARFYDEARAVNLIGHENIVGVYDLSVLPPDRYYFVMEYLDGETLAARLGRERLPPEVALDVLAQLCDALQCAHDHGVVHRDLKPENVFLVARRGKSHFVKLVDFGIAKLRGATTTAGAAGRTQAGLIIGTPEYMAPEQCEDGPVDARTDVYALGVMAFQLFTGQLPFSGRGVAQLLVAQVQQPPPRPSSLAPVTPALEAAVLRALEKDPARRFGDMAAFAEALRAAGAGRAAVAVGPVTSAAEPQAAAPAPAPDAAGRAPPREPEALPGLSAELLPDGAPPRRLPVATVTRAGLFLAAAADLPPLLARVRLRLTHPSLRAPLALEAEVVRHVRPADAPALRLPPGFAVQVVAAPPEARAALAALCDLAAPPAAAPPAPSAAAATARLDALAARAAADPYAVLALPQDADLSEVRRVARALREELEAVRLRPLAPEHPARAAALLARVDAAAATLGAPAARLAHDARAGNWRGVARCLAAGVPDELLEARRRALHAAEPARAAEAQRQLSRAQVARRLGNAAAARAAWEAALAADPLDRAALEAYLAWRGSAPP